MNQSTPYPVLPLLGRGLAAGGLAGLVSGLFSLLVAGPLLDRAVRLEEERESAAGHGHAHDHLHEELFSRGTQHVGLVVTAVVTGLAIGVFFALVHALIHRGTALTDRPWPRALALAAAGFFAVSLVPGLRYPANPPGVGEGDTVADRQLLWLAAIFIGILGAVLIRHFHHRMTDRPQHLRHLAMAGTAVATVIAVFLLPGNPDEVPLPADLVWDFRVLSLTAHGILWAVLGAAFGRLGLRRDVPPQASAGREGEQVRTAVRPPV
ncbi:CbtA family protein [Streptomyces sp. ACA25]|uniref:CbtA family protein n=1 Tax=Streptomyces sp. ACA25 TaxID=3022596 RepID=UPI002306F05A|nr:CbtA family protein [Streptomyces sp. ACA25]MDB1089537.1 CbtA family protein [Streptomyces sp. ACA25]